MEAVIILGGLSALLLGTGATRESKSRYGIGLLGVVIMAIASFFVMTVLHAVFFTAALIALAALTWFVTLTLKISGKTKR